MNEKQPIFDQEQPEELSTAAEEALQQEADTMAKHDGDAAAHIVPPSVSEENKQQDADDAVHKTTTVVHEQTNEIDPDELVHGQ